MISVNKEFLIWLKNIEITELDKNFIFLKKDIRDKLKNSFYNNENYSYETSLELEYYEKFATIENFFSPSNMRFNKIWKYKILYFLYAGFIYTYKWGIEKRYLKNVSNFNFFSKKLNYENRKEQHKGKEYKKVEWYAFSNGPLTNHYIPYGDDDPIYLDFTNFPPSMEEKLEKYYLFLKNNFKTQELVEESHKTDPWEKNYKNKALWEKLPNTDIVNYFQNKPPFYFEV